MIKTTVGRLIKKYRTNDPFEIASQKNVLVLFELLGDMLGYYNSSRRVQMIHINSTASQQDQRFTCAHELGHVILHPNVNTPFLRRHTFYSVDRIEREANQFAVELLMPDELLYESKHEDFTVQEAGLIYGVPPGLEELKKLN
ncbi:ImmA/IrrE family metallo-endopeptidase [Paenibacillus sp. LMG 31459]|uniref:ImmA/IrrE family metallo-endopeptidase n=1 Tax=Paenibacillus phytohabitans TaxID=2654978 RepID=A0ABX1YP09_9BACL|nr:ImmA/IrrE family metallo-endopeptidase [Paenibacillus phytohabitans]NOU82795.1 ImmA/IrrE family metallo-endopeptidase [Paenibacillus phytohabitans]